MWKDARKDRPTTSKQYLLYYIDDYGCEVLLPAMFYVNLDSWCAFYGSADVGVPICYAEIPLIPGEFLEIGNAEKRI